MGKVAQTLVTLTSHCDFHFKHLNMSFIENKLIVDLNSNCHKHSLSNPSYNFQPCLYIYGIEIFRAFQKYLFWVQC